MLRLLDQAFWRFVSGFVLILIISVSILTLFGMYQSTKENVAGLLQSLQADTLTAK